MQQGIEVPPFFPEPQLPDPTWAAAGESTVDWITRSTLPCAQDVRRFLNHNLEALPPRQQRPFAHNLRSRWDSALFELVVARLLQGLGGDLEIEVLNSDLRRPDFSLRFGASRFTIEAVAPKCDLKAAAKQKQDAELIEIVERNAPPAWSIFLTELPDIGPAESKVPFKKALRTLARESAPHTPGEHRDFVFPLSSGVFSGKLIAGRYGHRAVVGGPPYTEWSDSKLRISRALSRKKAQTRSEAVPVFLAVLASGVSSGFDDFDELLLGKRVSHLDHDFNVTHVSFEQSPKFAGRPLPNAYGGVLAFIGLSPFGVRGPILYVHPELAVLPSQFGAFEQRTVVQSAIVGTPPSEPSPIEDLCFANMTPKTGLTRQWI